jgi:ABC-type multidrug transport system fused ATPase/permease subunit
MTTSNRPRSLRSFLRPYRGGLSLASGLILVETLLDLARPWPLKLAVDNAIGGRPLGGPLAGLDQLGPAGLAAVAAVAGIGLVGVAALVGYLVTYLTAATAERVGADLREAVFGRMLGLALPFHDRHRSGDLVTRLTGDVARVEDSMVAWFTVLVPEVLTLAGMVVVVLAVDLTLGLAALAVAPPLAVVVALRRRRIRTAQRTSRDADAALAGEATEVLRNVRVVQAFTREPEAGARFSGRSRGAVRAALAAMDLEARWSPVADLLLAAGGALVLWLGVTAVTGGRMTLGTLLVVLAYLSGLYGPIRALARLARTLARGAASRERILEVLDSGEVVPGAADPVPAAPPRHGLTLRGVWFSYTEGARSCATSTWRSPPASGSAWSARPGPASRPCSPCSSGSTTPRPGRSSSTGSTCAAWSWGRCAASSPWSLRTRGCWTAPSPTTWPSDAPAPPRRSWRRRPGPPWSTR